MMKVHLLITAFLLFSGVAAAEDGASQPASEASVNADSGPIFLDPIAAFEPEPVETSGCSAQASCDSHGTVSCSSGPPSTCEAVDRNCSAGVRGYVRCGGSYTYCPILPCRCGEKRWINTYQCNYSYNLYIWKEQQCVNEAWQDTGNTDLLVCCTGNCL